MSNTHGRPCDCHPGALGHHFGTDLLCKNHITGKPNAGVCRTSWTAHQDDRLSCIYPGDPRFGTDKEHEVAS